MATATTTHIATTDLPSLVAELRATRARAAAALEEVRQAQRASAARLAEHPQSAAAGDTYRRVAGTTSLERAAEAAERVIASADRQLARLAPLAEVKGQSKHWASAR
jgi:hypothetical protein